MDNDIVNEREFFIQALKQSIRASFYPFVAEKYCQQIYDLNIFRNG